MPTEQQKSERIRLRRHFTAGRIDREQVQSAEQGRDDPVAYVAADDESDTPLAGDVADANRQQGKVPDAVHVARHADHAAEIPVVDATRLAEGVQATAQQCPADQQHGLVKSRTWVFQDGRNGDPAGVGQAFEVDHLLTQGNDETNAQECAGYRAEGQQHGIEVRAIAEDEDGRDREHHAAGCAVDRAGHGLRDVVLDDAVAPQDAAQNAEAEDGRQFRTLDGETEDQRGITDADGDDHAQEIADQDRRPGQFRIRSVANNTGCS
jgi:hypothetical protein